MTVVIPKSVGNSVGGGGGKGREGKGRGTGVEQALYVRR